MCVSFRCRYIRLEKLDKSSQDTLSLLVARSGTKRNRPPPSEKLAFQTPPADFAKCRRLQSVLFTLYPISPGSHIYPGTRRDIAALVAGGEVWWVSLLSFHQRSLYSVRYWWSKGRQRGFISSQARCFGAAGTW